MKNNLYSLQKFILVTLFSLASILGWGQNAIVGTGFSSGWGGGSCPTGNTDFKYLSAGAGTSYGVTTTANNTGNQYFRFGVDWSGTTAHLAITPGSDVSVSPNISYTLNTSCTTSGAQYINVANTSYNYVFKTLNAGTAPTGKFVFFEVQGAVRSVTSVSQLPLSGSVTVNSATTVTANLDGTLSNGQAVYLRYTTNGYSTSTVVQMTGSGTTYTGTIPAATNTAGANVSYYVFTSGTANVATDGSNADFYTINLNNNGGSNYSYTVNSPATIYLHNFGTTSIVTHPYIVSPLSTPVTGIFDTNLSNSSWSNSLGAWTSFAGSTGQALTIQPGTTARTITLTFDVASGKSVTITSFNYWRQRSSTSGPIINSITINGITVSTGVDTPPTTGAAKGVTNVANPVNALTGTITVVISLSTPSAAGTNLRLDDFTLNGNVVSIPVLPPVVTGASWTGTYNTAFSQTVSATNSPTSYTVASGTLPPGLTLNSTTGAVSGTPTAAGSYTVTITATNSGGTSSPATFNFTINKAAQTITFGSIVTKTYGDAPFTLGATASSGLTVSYSSSDTNVATVSGNTVTIVGAGTCIITASQTGDSNYSAATSVNQTLTVNKKALTITGITANNKVEDGTTTAILSGTPSLVGLVGTDDVSLSGTPTANFAQATAGTGIAVTVTGYTLSGTKAGNYTLTQPTGLSANITSLTVPVANDATNITSNSFIANWDTISGIDGYQLDVYTLSFGTGSLAESFESGLPTGYTTTTSYTLSSGTWTGQDSGVIRGTQGVTAGLYSCQLRSQTGAFISPPVFANGVNSVTVKAGASTTSGAFRIDYSTDGGTTWTQSSSLPATSASTTTYTININTTTSTLVRFIRTAATIYLDEVSISYPTVVTNYVTGYNAKSITNIATVSDNVTGLQPNTTYYYRLRSVKGTAVSVNSNVIAVCTKSTAYDVIGGGTYCNGGSGVDVGLSNSEIGVSYQLYNEGVATGSPVIGTGSAISFGNQTSAGAYTVKATYTNGSICSSNTDMSGSTWVIVDPISVGGTASANQTICSGNSPSNITLTGNVGNVVKWQSATDYGFTTGVTDINNTTTTLALSALTATTYYRAVVQSGICSTAYSSVVTITVNPPVNSGTISGNASLLIGNNSLYTISGNNAAGNWGIINAGGANASIDASGNVTAGTAIGTATVTYTVSTGCGAPVTSNFPITITDTTTWDGTAWDLGFPNGDINAIIDGDYSGASFAAKTLTINSGKSLDILGGTKVTVTDGITNNGTFTMQNEGNLIQINNAVNTGNIKVNRSTQDNLTRLDYVYWSSPVLGQGLKAFSPKTVLSRFYTYNEQTDGFVSVPNIYTATFTPGVGYAIRVPNDYTTATNQQYDGVFVGVPNNGNYSYSATKLGGGYNLVGNPYPSNLELDGAEGFYNVNSGVINNKFYFWTNFYANPTSLGSGYSGVNYAIWNASGTVTPGTPDAVGTVTPTSAVKVGQGFIVEAHTAGPLVFNNAMRTSASSTFISKNATPIDRYWISMVTPANNYYNQLIAYVDGATNDMDANYDAAKLETPSDDFYSILNENKLTIQGRQYPLLMSDVVSLGNKYAESGTYKITLSKKEGIFADGQSVYLHDKTLGTYTDLQQGDYSFTASQGEQTDRFEITYKPGGTLGTDNGAVKNLVVYTKDQNFVIEAPEKVLEVKLIDASGKLISTLTPNKNKIEINNATLINGVYVLQIRTATGITVKKVIK